MEHQGHRSIEAVIFDLDGTLADTLEDIADAMDRVLAGQDLPGHGYDAYRLMIGAGLRNLVTQALPRAARTPASIERSLELMLAEYGEHSLVKTRPYPGIGAALARLRDEDLPLAVLSNKADELTRHIVAGLFPPDTFAVVAGARPGLPLKPDPAAALLVAGRLGAAPAAIAYVGDSGIDMQTARGAGMRAVGVSWGFRSRTELVEQGASVVLDRPARLLELLTPG